MMWSVQTIIICNDATCNQEILSLSAIQNNRYKSIEIKFNINLFSSQLSSCGKLIAPNVSNLDESDIVNQLMQHQNDNLVKHKK